MNSTSQNLNKLLVTYRGNPRAQKRIWVILLSMQGNLTAAQIANRLHLARSTVFAYRRLHAEKGIEGLLARTKPGRPATPFSHGLEKTVIKGLRLLRWFNIPALREWVRGHDRLYPAWTIRRWALALIKRLRIRFPKNWKDEMENSYEEWRRSVDWSDNPLSRWRRARAMRASTDPTLNLVIEESPGLRPWLPLAA